MSKIRGPIREYNSISEDDINNQKFKLTDRQKEICLLRQKYNCREIAELLKLDQSTVYITYENAIKKILKGKQKENIESEIKLELSTQQNQIQILVEKGFKTKEIALALEISPATVSVQKNRIKKVLTKS